MYQRTEVSTGGIKTLRYLIADTEENYLKYLTEEDFFDNLLSLEEAKIIKNISQYIPLEYTLTTKLRDSREFSSFRNNKKMHFCFKNNHISELEIIFNELSYSDQYLKALLQVKNLKNLEELAIYYSIDTSTKEFVKSLNNFENLSDELKNIISFY